MAENVQETKAPEPPPKPPEVPKPTEQSNRSEAKDHGRPNESQQSAQQDARNAAQAEHAKATNGGEPDGLRPTPEFQARLDAHGGLRPTPEFQERLDAHTAGKAERGAAASQDSGGAQRSEGSGNTQRPQDSQAAQRSHDAGTAQRPQDSQAAQRPPETSSGATSGDRNAAAPAGEQAGEHAAARQAAAAERAKATEGTATPPPPQQARAAQAPEVSRNDEPVNASPPGESAAVRQQADQNAARGEASLDQNTQRQPTVDQDTTQRQPTVDESAQRQPAVHENAQRQPAVEESASPGETPNGNGTDDNPPGPPENGYSGPERRQHEAQHLDPADDLRDQPQTAPPDTETDKSAETAARLSELRDQGHGPQRHHDPTDEQLAARMGDPILDPQTGEPLLTDKGHVRAQNQIDPMTGTAVDGVHGGVHRCGAYATRIDSPEDYVAADSFMRQEIGDTGPAQARRPISEVLGPNAHERMTGYYHDPDAAGQLKPVDFTGGTIFAVYQRLPNGDLNLRSMYVDPAPSNPDQ